MEAIAFAILEIFIGIRYGVDGNHIAAITQLLLFAIGICITLCLSWGCMREGLHRILFRMPGFITGVYSLGLGAFMLIECLKGGLSI